MCQKSLRVAACVPLFALATGVCSALAAADAKLLAAATQAQPAVVDSLKEMVLIESGSSDLDGLARMATLLEGRLKAMGFKTERRKATAGAGADIVLGTLEGTGKQRLMLQGHMDTVYEKGILAAQPYKLDGNRLYGPGIADDKGGIAVILHALKILADAGWRDYARLTVLFNPDEEVGSLGSGELIATLADQHDTVLSFEPTAAKAVVKGEAVLLGARDLAKDIPGAALNWTNARAVKALNQIPDTAEALGDVRITQRGADEKLLAALKAKVAAGKLVPDTETTVKLVMGRPPFVAGAPGRALAERARAIYAEIDRPLAIVDMTGGGTDAGYANRSGKAVVVESFGLAGFGYHARDEYIELDSIVPRLYLVTRLMTELGRQ